MPIFDYGCPECEFVNPDVYKSVSNTDEPEICPKCDTKMDKLITQGPAFVLKGQGWSKRSKFTRVNRYSK